MSEQLPLAPGFFLYATKFPEKLNGAKQPAPQREWYATRAEAERAQVRFRHQYGGSINVVTTIVPAEQARKPTTRARR